MLAGFLFNEDLIEFVDELQNTDHENLFSNNDETTIHCMQFLSLQFELMYKIEHLKHPYRVNSGYVKGS